MLIEAFITERAFRLALLKVFTVFLLQSDQILFDKFVFLLFRVHPQWAGTYEIWRYTALWTGAGNSRKKMRFGFSLELGLLKRLPNDFVIELFWLSPLSNTLQTENVIAIRQDAETFFASGFLDNNLETNATRFVFRTGNGER